MCLVLLDGQLVLGKDLQRREQFENSLLDKVRSRLPGVEPRLCTAYTTLVYCVSKVNITTFTYCTSIYYTTSSQLIHEADKDNLMDEVLEYLNEICNFISTTEMLPIAEDESAEDDRVIQVIKAVVEWASRKNSLHEVSY